MKYLIQARASLHAEAVQGAAGAEIDPSVRDCGGCIARLVEVIERQVFKAAARFEDRDQAVSVFRRGFSRIAGLSAGCRMVGYEISGGGVD